MENEDVVIGGWYRVRVSGRIATVKITGVRLYGGWYGLNLCTNRRVHIRSARRLIARLNVKGDPYTEYC